MPLKRGFLLMDEKDDKGGDLGGGAGDKNIDRGDDHDPDQDQDKKTGSASDEDPDKDNKDKGGDKDDEAGKNKGDMIPKGRFNEAVAKERQRAAEAERRAKALEEELAKATKDKKEAESEIDKQSKAIEKLEDQLDDAIIDGDRKKAADLRRQLRDANDKLADAKAERRLAAQSQATKEEMKYERLLESLETDYPELDPQSDDFDEELAVDLAATRDGYTARGMSPSAALQRAVDRLLKPRKNNADADKARGDRASDARRRAADASDKTPPSTDKVGRDSDKGGARGSKKGVLEMTQDEFAKLTEDEKAAQRGDVL